MEKRKKLIFLLSSLALGLAVVLIVLLILTASGVLDISKPKLVISSASESFVYDGETHSFEQFELVSGNLQAGQQISAVFTGACTDAGTYENTFTAQVLDVRGADVTANYSIEYRFGTLTIEPRPISVSTSSATKMYDGEPLSCPQWKIVSETGLVEGHTVEKAVLPASQTDAGICENYVSEMVIKDGEKDVTANYAFTYFPGELTVTPRTLTVRSGSASKNYDGTPLLCGEWEVVSATQPITGHSLEVVVSGERTEVGESANTISEVRIIQNGTNVTFNYEIKLQEGTLVVRGSGSGETGGPGGNGNGANLNTGGSIGSGMISDNEDTPAAQVYAEEDGKVYLRLMSFGDYTGSGWEQAAAYTGTLPGGFGMNYLTGIALKNAGYTSGKMKIRPNSQDYLLPYYLDTSLLNYTVQGNDVVYTGDTSSEYAMYCYSYDFLSDGWFSASLGAYAQQEKEYAAYVRQNYLSVPESTREFLDTLIEEQHLEGDTISLIGWVAEYIRNAAKYDLAYDKSLDVQPDIVVSFLRDYKTGICQHYASAAVMLYRALGIPARYTVGYAADIAAYEWTDVTASQAHAWAEVYLDGIGWVRVEVTGGSQGGTGNVGGDAVGGSVLIVRPVTEYMKYDGVNTLYPSGQVQGLSELLEKGFHYKAEVAGSRRDAGISLTSIRSFSLYDPTGKDVTDTYDIRFAAGKLQVYLQEITIKTQGATKVYDGTPLPQSACEMVGNLLYGHRAETFATTGSCLNVGRVLNTFTLRIVDETGKNVTDVYKINSEYGVLEIQPRPITIIANSNQKMYDGSALRDSGYTIENEAEALADGQSIAVRVEGSQTLPGQSENIVADVLITDEAGNDVTENYRLILISGVLQVIA